MAFVVKLDTGTQGLSYVCQEALLTVSNTEPTVPEVTDPVEMPLLDTFWKVALGRIDGHEIMYSYKDWLSSKRSVPELI